MDLPIKISYIPYLILDWKLISLSINDIFYSRVAPNAENKTCWPII